MVVYIFTPEHAENTESHDRCEVLGFRFEEFGLLTSDNSQLIPSFNAIPALSPISAASVNDNFRKDKSKKIESFKYCGI